MGLRQRVLRWARIGLINGLLLLFFLVVLDLVFGNWFRESNLGPVEVLRDVEFTIDVSDLYAHDGPIAYRRDEFGLRGTYDDLSKIDILTIGSSTTDQKFLDEGETWQDFLREEFARRGHALSVVNAGIAGRTAKGQIANFEHWFPRIDGLKSRFVLAQLGGTDMFEERHARDDTLVQQSLSRRVRQIYQNNSIYYHVYKTIKGTFRAWDADMFPRRVDFEKATWTAEPVNSGHAGKFADRLQIYEQRLRRLVALIREFGAVPIFITHARGDIRILDGKVLGMVDEAETLRHVYARENGIDRYIVQNLFNDSTLAVCREAAAICIDLAGDLQADFEPGDFYDRAHYTPEGAARMAAYLYEVLKDTVLQ